MDYRSILCVFAFIICLAACSSETDNPYTRPAAKPETGLQLNNGARWRADEATNQNIRTMQETVGGYTTTAGSQNYYPALGRELRADLNKTYRDCTMNGAGHDMLHKFLLPVEKDIELLEGPDEEAAMRTQIRLEEHLNTFDAYFE